MMYHIGFFMGIATFVVGLLREHIERSSNITEPAEAGCMIADEAALSIIVIEDERFDVGLF